MIDRHVAMMNAWPITDVEPSVDFGITNWLETSATARIDVVVEHNAPHRLRGESPPAVRRPFAANALLALDTSEPDVARRVDALSRDRAISSRTAKTFRRALAGPPITRAQMVKRLATTPRGAGGLDLEISPLETRRRLFLDNRGVPRRPFFSVGTDVSCGLPTGRHPALEGLELAPLEERMLRLSVGRRPKGEAD